MSPQIGPEDVVVFDIDDTLYLERTYVRSGFDAVGRLLADELGAEDAADRLWSGFESGVRGDAFNQLLAGYGLPAPDGLVDRMVACYRCHRPSISLLDDARDLLHRLGRRPTAAISDGPAASQRAKAEVLGLYQRLDHVVLTADLGPGRGKPDPAAFALVEDLVGRPGSSCWYLADNPTKDFDGPQSRGWHAVRVRREGSLHHALPSPDGVPEVTNLTEIIT